MNLSATDFQRVRGINPGSSRHTDLNDLPPCADLYYFIILENQIPFKCGIFGVRWLWVQRFLLVLQTD